MHSVRASDAMVDGVTNQCGKDDVTMGPTPNDGYHTRSFAPTLLSGRRTSFCAFRTESAV